MPIIGNLVPNPQPVSGTVSVGNTPAVTISGTPTVNANITSGGGSNAIDSASGTIVRFNSSYTVPAGRIFEGSYSLASYSGYTGGSPSSSSAGLSINGQQAVSVGSSNPGPAYGFASNLAGPLYATAGSIISGSASGQAGAGFHGILRFA